MAKIYSIWNSPTIAIYQRLGGNIMLLLHVTDAIETLHIICKVILGVFTSTGVTGYKGIRVTFCNVFKWRKVTLLPCYRVTPVLVNTPIMFSITFRICDLIKMDD